jgi:hypothetical protein
VVNLIVPISTLAILNYFICKALTKSQIQARLMRRGTTASEENLRKRDERLAQYERSVDELPV